MYLKKKKGHLNSIHTLFNIYNIILQNKDVVATFNNFYFIIDDMLIDYYR